MPTHLLLAPGSVLVHIGPYKTGSTTIQYALFARQDELRERGVLFPGDTHRQRRPGWGVLGWTPPGRKRAGIDEWNRLVADLHDVGEHRVCLTTEDFGWASQDQATRIVTDLGVPRVHVLAVARRLDRLLPSEWQERVKTFRETKSYPDWLRAVLADDRSDPSADAFWASHDVGRQLANWTSALPAQQLTLVVTDDTDHRMLSRTFEQMLGLPDGFLQATVDANPSLTEERVELIRALNDASARHQWGDRLHMFAVEVGVKSALMDAPTSTFDHKLPSLPTWAVERVRQLAEEQVSAIGAAGVNIVGDPTRLRIPLDVDTAPASAPPTGVAVQTATMALEGAVDGAARLLAETHKRHRREVKALRQELQDAQRQLADRAEPDTATAAVQATTPSVAPAPQPMPQPTPE